MATADRWRHELPGNSVRPGAITLWRIDLNAAPDQVRRAEALLSNEELARAGRFFHAGDRTAFVLQRAHLRAHLGASLGHPAREVGITEGERGKPRLADSGPGLAFNASRSGGWCLIALSRVQEIGVDIERHCELDADALARRYFSEEENAALGDLDKGDRRIAFFEAWVRKEAFVKALGLGLSFPLNRFSVTLAPGVPARLTSLEGSRERAGEWSMHALRVSPGYSAAVVGLGGPLDVHLRESPPLGDWAG